MALAPTKQQLWRQKHIITSIMMETDLTPTLATASTYASLLQTCVNMKNLSEGKLVHAHMIQTGFKPSLFLETKLVILYAKCGGLANARRVLDGLSQQNLVALTAMISGYSRHGFYEEALGLFNQMERAGVRPDKFAFASVLPAISHLRSLERGKDVHRNVIIEGFHSDAFVRSGLIDMYIKCGKIEDAGKVFEKITERDVIDWNALVSGYVKNGRVDEALELFWAMPERNVVSWTTMIAGYAQKGCMDKALEMFQRMPERNVFSWTAMVAGYARNGLIGEAMELFWEMPERNVVSWTAMIAGYVQNGCFEEALEIFWKMKMTDVEADSETLAGILPACANLAALEQGKEVHEEIIRSGFLANVFVGSALVDMYAKCGSIEDARKVFDRMHEQNIVLWNAMIAGYAMHGCSKEALQLFGQMKNCSTNPDHLTFLSVLSACCHRGLVDDGWQYFNNMTENYGIMPAMDHYSCMVDLLGRAGLLNEAENFINQMPMKPDACVWEPLLGACRIHNNVELGECVAGHLFELDPTNAAHYVLLSNMYAAVGRWDGIEKVRNMMRDRSVKKMPGCSWIEVNNKVYTFLTGDKIRPHMQDIHTKLDECSLGR